MISWRLFLEATDDASFDGVALIRGQIDSVYCPRRTRSIVLAPLQPFKEVRMHDDVAVVDTV
jgi:hypothetical protein